MVCARAQDISVAGHGEGLGGQRSGLFSEIMRLAQEIKPKFIFLENVPAIRTRGLDHVAEWFASIGYDCRWDIVSASEVGAPHLRKRWFLLACANGERLRKKQRTKHIVRKRQILTNNNGSTQFVADAESSRLSRRESSYGDGETKETQSTGPCYGRMFEFSGTDWWKAEPSVGRVADGIPNRMDRLKCLGNSVVPEQAREAFKRLCGLNDS